MFSGRKKDELDDTLLRSIILFNQREGAPRSDDMMSKAILAVITKGAGKYTLMQIKDMLNRRFGVAYDEKTTKAKISHLIKERMVRENPDGTYVALQDSGEGSEFYRQLEERTQQLIQGVVERVRHCSAFSLTSHDESKLANNTKKALSAYYHLYGYSFFGLKSTACQDEVIDAVSIAREGLSQQLGEALVRALFDVINTPTDRERNTLETWARAFVALEILNLDPLLRNFTITRIRNKTFVIDTDVVLHCLAGYSKYSKDYLSTIEILRNAVGCVLVLPYKVLDEVKRHLMSAPAKAREFGPSLDSLTDELIENSNVFVEGYVKKKRSGDNNADLDFETYLYNIFDRQQPVMLKRNLKKIFGERYVEWTDKDLVEIDDSIKQKFANEIRVLTSQSIKGASREDYQNKDIAEADARMYLTIKKRNEDAGYNDVALSHKTYLLTQSKKIKSTAERILNDRHAGSCVCTPAAMLSILNEIGMCGSVRIEYINLFENPFLTYTAEKIWNQVEPLIKKGAKIKHKDLERLRLDVDTHFDNLLSGENLSENEAKVLSRRGYEFAAEIMDVSYRLKKLQEERDQLAKEIEAFRNQEAQRSKTEKLKKRTETYKRKLNKKKKH